MEAIYTGGADVDVDVDVDGHSRSECEKMVMVESPGIVGQGDDCG